MQETANLSAIQMARLVRARELSPVELVRDSLDRIEQRNKSVNAFVTVCAGQALEAAERAERAVLAGETTGPLHGVPIGVKDLDAVAGIPVTRGSRVFADRIAKDTVLSVARLQRAGAIVVGKTNTSEFGYKAVTDNTLFGPTSTPFNLAMNAGGSSGGSAAAVAEGLVPLAHGSDGGGSLRIPAAFCGVFTMMTTFGRVAVPARPNAFRRYSPQVCHGVLSRSVADCAVALDAMSGSDPRDPYSFTPQDELTGGLTRSLSGKRIAYVPDLGGYPVEPEVERVARAALPALAEAGAKVVEADFQLPVPHGEITAMWRRFLSVCHAESAEFSRRQGTNMVDDFRGVVDDGYIESVMAGGKLSALDLRMTEIMRTQVLDAFTDLFESYDLVVSPVNGVTGIPNASNRTTVGPREVAGQPVDPLVGWSLTVPFNLIGSPAASVPAGRSGNGVPVGLQIVGPRFHDVDVITACAAFERQRPWHDEYLALDGLRGKEA
ncbi:amidase [Streptomyces sp. YIM B13518]|uniref:amidase n=1 Tax=Streptomyces sp. YIM B13518 TaxID=3366316 RepID=UPI0036A4E409